MYHICFDHLLNCCFAPNCAVSETAALEVTSCNPSTCNASMRSTSPSATPQGPRAIGQVDATRSENIMLKHCVCIYLDPETMCCDSVSPENVAQKNAASSR